MRKYNYKNCQSLFGYSAQVHARCKAKCQLCGCGGEPISFDLWRQLTVEHLIGKSQEGYLFQIKSLVDEFYPELSSQDSNSLATAIDQLNTVTACQFCNSTTSRDVCSTSMREIFTQSGSRESLIHRVKVICNEILLSKRENVRWKLEAVREAFECQVVKSCSES